MLRLSEVKTRYELRYELDQAALRAAAVQDGVFPLITNDRELSEQALLLAYKGQGSTRGWATAAFQATEDRLSSCANPNWGALYEIILP